MGDSDLKGFATGLDESFENSFDENEKRQLLSWYEQNYGLGDLDLVKFVPFLIEHSPRALKLFRRHVAAIAETRDGVGLPPVVVDLLFLHLYTVLGNERGIFYEIIGARGGGASKAQVLETISYAFLESGPSGANAVAELTDAYLRDWNDDDSIPSEVAWPEGWSPNPEAFRSGIDLDSNEFTHQELETLGLWHSQLEGREPRYVKALTTLHPAAYKTYRARYERSIGGVLPAQVFPLYTLHLAVVRSRQSAIRASLQVARRLGVRRHHVAQTMWWGFLYGEETALEEAMNAVEDLLEDWA
jgi:hypothetical protein